MGCSFITFREPCNNQRPMIAKVAVKHQSIKQSINDLEVIVHGFMSQIIHITVLRVKRLNDHALRLIVQPF